ncbi:MAG: thioredoxin-disulfide reductase [Desulfobacteraceae bacterium]|nr:MAG: thioredoxin-disulfide reductase [Desulfobacteraceae bacterium]
MAQSEMYDLAIIGGGPGGLSAAIYAMRAALKTVLIEKAVPGGQVNLSDEVENYPGYTHINGSELAMRFAEHARSYGLEEVNDEVVSVEPGLEYHGVRLSGGREIRTHAVILATGGTPRKLDVPGEQDLYGKGVSYCAVCDGFFFRGKQVIVVGGGDSACEEGLYLAKLAQRVYLVHRRDSLRASRILQQRVTAECKMEVLWNSAVSEILSGSGGVTGVTLQDTQTGRKRQMSVDGVFIFIGFEPNNQLVPAGVRMSTDGFVITDDQCSTAIPGIYAIGDLKEKYARQIVLSAADGCLAALSAAHYVETRKAKMGAEICELPEILSAR